MDFYELSSSRRSVRSFTESDVSKSDLVKLIEAARSAPSAGNCQPWHFFVVKDNDVKAKIVEKSYGQNWILKAPAVIVVCADINRTTPRYGERGRHLYCLQDTAAAVQNILLCAKDMGLGTCWIGAFDEEGVAQVLNLQEDMRPVAIIPVGYPASASGTSKRRPIEEIMTFIGGDDGETVTESVESHPKFEHSDMSQSVFDDVCLADSTFNNVNLENSAFSDINFKDVAISDANLSGGVISSCDLTNLKISESKIDGLTVNGKDISELIK